MNKSGQLKKKKKHSKTTAEKGKTKVENSYAANVVDISYLNNWKNKKKNVEHKHYKQSRFQTKL